MSMLLLRQLTQIFAPLQCLACDRRAPQILCARCYHELLKEQRTQALIAGQSSPVWAWANYSGLVKKAMHQLKYEGAYGWGQVFGEFAGRWWQELPSQSIPWQVVPIPLATEKLKSRGYNQAEEISRIFSGWVGYTHCPQWLSRIRHTQAQHSLGVEARKDNLRGAFHASPQVRGKSILLVDDIYTTGSTIAEVSQVLKDAGAAQVGTLVIARPSVWTP